MAKANQLESLKRHSTIVADTGDIDSIGRFRPQDATTNPSLILKAAQDARYRPVIDEAVAAAATTPAEARAGDTTDRLFVGFGRRILELVPGRVSSEVAARLSFDTDATEAKARRLIDLYEAAGVPRERVLIKIASTWEGTRAAERLERDGIHCNLTLLFSFARLTSYSTRCISSLSMRAVWLSWGPSPASVPGDSSRNTACGMCPAKCRRKVSPTPAGWGRRMATVCPATSTRGKPFSWTFFTSPVSVWPIVRCSNTARGTAWSRSVGFRTGWTGTGPDSVLPGASSLGGTSRMRART